MTDVRAAVTEALHNWALMYPIPAWGLAQGEAAERLAANWARVAAGMVVEALGSPTPAAPADDDVAALRAEILTGWWEVDEAGRDQALARLDRIAARLAGNDWAARQWLDRNHLHVSFGGGPPTVIDVPPLPAAGTD